MPYLCLSRHHVRSNAHKRHRQVHEAHPILISDRKGTYQIAYILAIDISGWETSKQVPLEEIRSLLIIGTDIEDIISMNRIKAIVVSKLHPEIILFIEERDGEKILFLILHVSIGNVLSGQFVSQCPIPVHIAHDAVHLLHGIAQGIQTADKTSHAGTQDHIHRYSELFDPPYNTHMRSTFGSAAAENKSNRWTIHPYLSHSRLHSRDSDGISLRVHTPASRRHRQNR